jgi:hypothetical protein
MFISCKRASACLALVMLEASCTSTAGSLVPTNSAVNTVGLANVGARAPAGGSSNDTIVGCRLVRPRHQKVLNPPPEQAFALSPSFNPAGYVFYFEIGMGNSCYSVPQAELYTTVPGTLNKTHSRVMFESGHNELVLDAGKTYEFVAYAVPAEPAQHLYEIDDTSSDVLVFLAYSNGNVAPEYRITNVGGKGAAPQGIAVDKNGYVYVTTIAADGVTTSLIEYAPGARGDAKPVRVITGPDTTLTNNSSDTGVGPDGSVYVNGVKHSLNGGNGIAVFAPNEDGDARPSRLVLGPNGGGAAVSPSGLLYVTTAVGTGNEAALDVFGPKEHGNEPPEATVEGDLARISTNLTAVDAQGNVYLCRNAAAIEFAPYQQGNVNPIRQLKGGHTGFSNLQPIAVDGAANVFVAGTNPGRIYRFRPAADGNEAPVAIIAGSKTGAVSPAAIAVGK